MPPCPRLPIELFTEISAHLPEADILNLALANKQLYDLSIGKFYSRVDIASVYDGLPSLDGQKSSLECIRALFADGQKRRGVESIKFHGMGMNAHMNEDVVIPEPYGSAMKARLDEWNSAQPILTELANTLLTGDYDFPRLITVWYDANALLTEQEVERFFAFVERHPSIQNVMIAGDNTSLFHKWTFSRIPEHLVCRLPDLGRAIIYGPLLPLLLGFSFLPDNNEPPSSGDSLGPLIRHHTMPDTLPLKRVHTWWPKRFVPVVVAHPDNNNDSDSNDDSTDQVLVILNFLDVIKALGSLCGSSLEVLSIEVDDEGIDEALIDLISTHFPNLRELYLCPACSDPMARLPNHNFLRRVAEKLSRLRHLACFMYRLVVVQPDRRYQPADVLKLTDDWRDTISHFSRCCPSIEHIRLYSLGWGTPLPLMRWG